MNNIILQAQLYNRMPANALLCNWQLIGYKYRFIRRVQHKLPYEHGLGQGGLPALRIHD